MIGLAKGGFGGLGVLLTPILALVLPVAQAVGVLLPMLMVGDGVALIPKINLSDGVPGGLEVDEAVTIAQLLEASYLGGRPAR